MPVIALKQVTLPGGDREVRYVAPGTVLADHEIPEYMRNNLRAGDRRLRTLFRELSDEEARALGAKLTAPRPTGTPDPVAVHPDELRWSGANPNDELHARDLERRVADLESRVSGVRGRRQRELIQSDESALPMDQPREI